MEERNEIDKVDDVMLPGFRFHPTDEELVGFYLKSKVQNRSLPIELIKQVDIYKYDPWDLPKELATTEEKEWYFYCQRDRKYRNSTRPNRVTGAGFWKATGTDRPIYCSDTTKCIGLKKSLVFYRGRAAKGIKTDWMMHEFRLPSSTSTSDSSQPNKLFVKSLPLNDSWAICRIFKKTNSMAQRALSHSWVPGLPEIAASDHMITQGPNYPQFSTIEVGPDIQFCTGGHLQLQNTTASYNNKLPTFPFSNEENFNEFVYSPPVLSGTTKSIVDQTFMLLNPSMMGNMGNNSDFGSPEQQLGGFSMSLPQDIIAEDDAGLEKIPRTSQDNNQSKAIRSIGFPFSLSADDV